MESPKESIHAYNQFKTTMALNRSQHEEQMRIVDAKTRDRALLPTVYIVLVVAVLFFCRGLWYHDWNLIIDGVIYAGATGFFYLIYRKTLI